MTTVVGRPELVKKALLVERLSIAWMLAEGAVAVVSGIAAHSVSLVVFGFNSGLELVVGVALYSQLRGETRGDASPKSAERERRALWAVGITLWLLCTYVVFDAARALRSQRGPVKSVPGLAVAVAALILTPLLAGAKLRLGRQIPNRALVADGKETIACGWLSAVVLVGVILNTSLGWWWADSAAALVMVPFLVLEGRDAIQLARAKSEGDASDTITRRAGPTTSSRRDVG
jgi:divalent metal cation (Fe/Co/Zn/Cd) transporter